tara:strand:+ start:13718 stop:14056 length:339 start_codon:yes stop_codon:yes gene_type:complete
MVHKDLLLVIAMLTFAHIVIWFQVNAQVVWAWYKNHIFLLCLLGVPISYIFFKATEIGYEVTESLWAVRFLAFGTSMITFPIMTYFLTGEGIEIKTVIAIGLSVIIVFLQLK